MNADGNSQVSEIFVTDVGTNLVEDLEVSTVRDCDDDLEARFHFQFFLKSKLAVPCAHAERIVRLFGPVSHLPLVLEFTTLIRRNVLGA